MSSRVFYITDWNCLTRVFAKSQHPDLSGLDKKSRNKQAHTEYNRLKTLHKSEQRESYNVLINKYQSVQSTNESDNTKKTTYAINYRIDPFR